jgi:hypothetical protein
LTILVTQKKLKNHYIRNGEHPFVILASFAFSAKNTKWNKDEIEAVIKQMIMRVL